MRFGGFCWETSCGWHELGKKARVSGFAVLTEGGDAGDAGRDHLRRLCHDLILGFGIEAESGFAVFVAA